VVDHVVDDEPEAVGGIRRLPVEILDAAPG